MHKIFPLFFFFFLIQFLSLFRRKVLIENLFNQEAESPANQCRKDNTEPWEIHQQYPSCAEENKYRNRSCRVRDHHQKGYPQDFPDTSLESCRIGNDICEPAAEYETRQDHQHPNDFSKAGCSNSHSPHSNHIHSHYTGNRQHEKPELRRSFEIFPKILPESLKKASFFPADIPINSYIRRRCCRTGSHHWKAEKDPQNAQGDAVKDFHQEMAHRMINIKYGKHKDPPFCLFLMFCIVAVFP